MVKCTPNQLSAEYAGPEAEVPSGSSAKITPLPPTFLEFFDDLTSVTRGILVAYHNAHANALILLF